MVGFLRRVYSLATHKIASLPVIVLMPHSRCNCRCVMCDIWKANHVNTELSEEVLIKHTHHFKKLGVREVVFSGGEALMHANLWRLCSILRANDIKITLLSTGLLLQKNAVEIIKNCNSVIVSLDGSQPVHDKIRNIPNAFEKLMIGVKELKRLSPNFEIKARCVLQRYNFSDFINIVASAKKMELTQISFLAADVSSSAFNRPVQWTADRVSEIALNEEEAAAFRKVIDDSFFELKEEYASKFIAESPKKMRKIVEYYEAVNGLSQYPETICNAPWVSTVIDSDGSVMPCFFHKPYGNIHETDFLDVINSPGAIAFRRNLKVNKDPVCKKCVCSLKLGITQLN